MPSSRETRADLQATVAARRELGSDYDDVLVDSFLDRIDTEIERRVDARVADRMAERALDRPGPPAGRTVRQDVPLLALASLALGVPLTALATNVGGDAATKLFALVVVWLGIAAVNLASALRRDRPR